MYICFNRSQVNALAKHKPTADAAHFRVDELANKPVSEIDAVSYTDLLTTEKKVAAVVEADVKDAKRRIKANKPKKTRQTKAVDVSDEDDAEDSEN